MDKIKIIQILDTIWISRSRNKTLIIYIVDKIKIIRNVYKIIYNILIMLWKNLILLIMGSKLLLSSLHMLVLKLFTLGIKLKFSTFFHKIKIIHIFNKTKIIYPIYTIYHILDKFEIIFICAWNLNDIGLRIKIILSWG